MCGRYSVQKKTLLVANSLVKKNINVDLDHDNLTIVGSFSLATGLGLAKKQFKKRKKTVEVRYNSK